MMPDEELLGMGFKTRVVLDESPHTEPQAKYQAQPEKASRHWQNQQVNDIPRRDLWLGISQARDVISRTSGTASENGKTRKSQTPANGCLL